MTTPGAGANERGRIDDLCSETWDRPDDGSLRARFVIFSAQRSGSEWLCDYLRRCGIGIPFEYFNHEHMPTIGGRLGCMLAPRRIDFPRYIALLDARRARNGIFGTKLQPDQLRVIFGNDRGGALEMLRRFDRVIFLRRRDRLLQAISLARAQLTNQWHLYRDDRTVAVSVPDETLFALIDEALAKIGEDDRYMSELVAALDPGRVRMLWYEDLADSKACEGVADWVWAVLGGAPRPEVDRSLELPRKLDESEARAIEARYLSRGRT
ncbi:MAG TPA: Stf0 family sulfotransferase [Stellaceae bacterium]|nr:Stf0 family sulfotransferase [Stellaceae bacterium]